MKKMLLSFILIVLFFSFLYLFFLRETDEDRIWENPGLFSETISKKKEEGPQALLAKIRTIKGLSMPGILIDMENPVADHPIPLLRGIDEVTGVYCHAFQLVEWIEVRLRDISIEVKEGSASALVAMTVDSHFLELGSEETTEDVRKIDMSLQKVDDEWMVSRVEEVL